MHSKIIILEIRVLIVCIITLMYVYIQNSFWILSSIVFSHNFVPYLLSTSDAWLSSENGYNVNLKCKITVVIMSNRHTTERLSVRSWFTLFCENLPTVRRVSGGEKINKSDTIYMLRTELFYSVYNVGGEWLGLHETRFLRYGTD